MKAVTNIDSFAKGLATAFIMILSMGCSSTKRLSPDDQQKGLKDYYKSYFPIGVAVNTHNIAGKEGQLIISEFNSITPENAMKMGPIHPKENFYYWKDADSIIAFARNNHLKVRGHNLCWHEQSPSWIFEKDPGDKSAANSTAWVGKDSLFKRLKDHISTVVNRYKKDIYAWDVVNEAIDDDSAHFLRNSRWLQICGPSFIDSAFYYAHSADPEAQLFYNDYNVIRPEKRERIYKLLKGLKQRGVPVTGIGIQAHWSVYEPSKKDLITAIERFASLGLKIQFTELDVSIYPWEKNTRQKKPGEQDIYTTELQKKQEQTYKMIFDIFRQYKKYITGVTFWNVSDKYSWLDYYPVEGRKNYPLLFDTSLQRKSAYWQVVNF